MPPILPCPLDPPKPACQLPRMHADAFDRLLERGFIQQTTDAEAIKSLLAAGPTAAYVGFDPTASSLHVGHLFSLMAMRHLEDCGHTPVVLIGGGTAMVGDPSGKTQMRPMLTPEDIQAQSAALASQFDKILDLGGKSKLVNNAEWLLGIGYIDFLRTVGRHFSVNRMLTAEAYKQRLEKGLSFLEFNYQLLQAYDFVTLFKKYGVRLQMGGDDQWGNIVAGVSLCRKLEDAQVYGLTSPLLTTAAGEKMGKTAEGAVWLDAQKCSPYRYHQYWIQCDDRDVMGLLGRYTFLPMEEIQALSKLSGQELNDAKAILAFEATQIVHGKQEALDAHQAALASFGNRILAPYVLPTSQIPRQVQAQTDAIPSTTLGSKALGADLQDGHVALAVLLVSAGLCRSRNEARRKIGEGAVRIGSQRPTDGHHKVPILELSSAASDGVVLRLGNKKVHRIVWNES